MKKVLEISVRMVYNRNGHGCPWNSIYPLEGISLNESTIQFSLRQEPENEMRLILRQVYQALDEKGYNPISQMVGYILSEDPTYITTHNNARSLVRRIDRDELLQELVREYLANDGAEDDAAGGVNDKKDEA